MQIQFYNNASEKNKLDKSLTRVFTLNGTLKDRTSITDPVITIERSSFPANVNYMVIPDFSNRAYFVNEIVSIGKNLWEIRGHVDVLRTYRAQIRTLDAYIERNEWGVNDPNGEQIVVNALADPLQLTNEENYVTFKTTSSGVLFPFYTPLTSADDPCVILTTINTTLNR